jgi:hypothetical protein
MLWLCLLVTASGGALFSQESRPQTALPEIEANNIQELRGRVGQSIQLTGEVSRIGTSGSGHRFLNFNGNPELTVFIPATVSREFRPEPPEKLFPAKTVRVTGKLERFKNTLQIAISRPSEIEIVERATTAGSTGPKSEKLPEPVELIALSRDTWKSPAGLIYSGYDPDGRTRKDHVLRHAVDDPHRDGPHGVFDGGKEYAFAWIDAAWKIIQEKHLTPQHEEGRDVYTVSMGQRIGYLGGETGARKGHPPLTHIFIVVRSGTREVVTAFPK